MANIKKVVGYALNDRDCLFGNWAYNDAPGDYFFMAKVIGVYDSNTGDIEKIYFDALSPKFRKRYSKIDEFRGLPVKMMWDWSIEDLR